MESTGGRKGALAVPTWVLEIMCDLTTVTHASGAAPGRTSGIASPSHYSMYAHLPHSFLAPCKHLAWVKPVFSPLRSLMTCFGSEVTLKHVMRERKGLSTGFTHARCLQGAGKECGRCVYIEEWDGLAIPEVRPGAAPDAWVAVLRSHMIRRRVVDKVETLHTGGVSPWEGDAATGRSLKAAKGVEYLTRRQAAAAMKEHNGSYKEWLKNNPNNK